MFEMLVLGYAVLVGAYLFVVAPKRWLLNPAALWVAGQSVFFLGLVGAIDWNIDADRVHILVMAGGLLGFIFGTILVDLGKQESRRHISDWLRQPYKQIEAGPVFDTFALGLLLIAFVVSIGYYQSVGYNIFLMSFKSYFLSGTGLLEDVAQLRWQSYAGPVYFAPGFVGQFKNVLLPLLAYYFVARCYLAKNNPRRCLAGLLIATGISATMLFGTGQRGSFFVAMLMVWPFLISALYGTPKLQQVNLVLGALSVSLFTLTTFFLQRVAVFDLASVDSIWKLLTNVIYRLTASNQTAALYGFRLIYQRQIQNGAEWLLGLRQLLPGQVDGLSLATEVAVLVFRSARGTAPVSIWGSLWYNFGLPGVIIFPVVLGVFYQMVYVRLVSGDKTLFRLLVYAGLFASLGTWMTGGPVVVVSSGFIALTILRLLEKGWMRMSRGRAALGPQAPGAQQVSPSFQARLKAK